MFSHIKKVLIRKIIKNQANTPIKNKNKIKFSYLKESPKYSIHSFGKKNKNKYFYLIKIDKRGGGLFANLLFVLQHLEIADKFNLIPVVDMENFYTLYNENNKVNQTRNSWEYYFEKVSKYSLKEVYQSKNVVITDGFFSNSMSRSYKEAKGIKKIYNKYIKIKKKFIKNADEFVKKNINDKKVLGVQIRGTNMRTTPSHPMPPTLKQIFSCIDRILFRIKFDKIFLVTDQLHYLEEFKKKYKSMLCFRDSIRSNVGNIFHLNIKKNHRYELGRDALEEMLILSKLKFIICSRSNVSEAALMISKNSINFFELNNGFNSKKILYSQFKWFLKSNLPEKLGGFKSNINVKFKKFYY
jgi:hypothetical protein